MLIDAQTAAKAEVKQIWQGQTLQVRGVLALNVIAIEIPDGAGGWKSLTENGLVVQLDANNEQLAAIGNTLIRVNKPITTNAVGVALI
jgi:hypothetical protein